MIGADFRLAIYQFAPALQASAANARRIARAAAEAGADLVLTPELALTGYHLGDDAAALAVPLSTGRPLPVAELAPGPALVLGLVQRGKNGLPYNAAVHVEDSRVHACHRKIYLPTYGMFDEARFFARGSRVRAYDAGDGWRFGLLICEDLWHPALTYVLAAQGIHALLVLAAAPGRGVWEGGEAGGRFASSDAWERIARATAQLYGVYVVLANRVGVEGGITFAGGSLIAGPGGELLARAPAHGEMLLHAELSLDEVHRARRPFAHARDDDADLIRRELDRLLGQRNG